MSLMMLVRYVGLKIARLVGTCELVRSVCVTVVLVLVRTLVRILCCAWPTVLSLVVSVVVCVGLLACRYLTLMATLLSCLVVPTCGVIVKLRLRVAVILMCWPVTVSRVETLGSV